MDRSVRQATAPMSVVPKNILLPWLALDWQIRLKSHDYVVYQSIELRIPQRRIAMEINQLFGLDISRNVTNKFKSAAAQMYKRTYDKLLRGLCKGGLLHIDETAISIKQGNGYVWVLTSMEEVVYFYTPTREGSTIRSMLRKFRGVLVTDFYAAYDAIECPQQKCLIHLIRDLNDELLSIRMTMDLGGLSPTLQL